MRHCIKMMWDVGADQSLGLPAYGTPGAAGADLKANFLDRADVLMQPGARALITTGLRLAIPVGFEVQIRPRSGLALKYGITLANAPGTIDSDYRGPLGVILLNTGAKVFTIFHGDRVAQMVLAPVVQADFTLAMQLDDTDRGQGGFGSTGQN
jgi:dUTP pyrophosphatase